MEDGDDDDGVNGWKEVNELKFGSAAEKRSVCNENIAPPSKSKVSRKT